MMNKEPTMGEPAAVFKVNGTKLQSRAPVPCRCEGISVEQFWSERLQALKRHLESTQTSSDTRPTGGRT